MKFLLDMNLPRSLGEHLREYGPTRHAAELGLAQASDDRLLEEARATGSVLLTHDLDFGRLLAFSGATQPSVIIFRGVSGDAEGLARLVSMHWPTLRSALESGAIAVIEGELVRVRRLPVAD